MRVKSIQWMICGLMFILLFTYGPKTYGISDSRFADQNVDIMLSQSSDADTLHEKWQPLNRYASEAIELAEKKEYAAAKAVVQNLENTFLQLDIGAYIDRVEQVNILTETIIQAKQALARVEPREEEIKRSLMRMRLAFDAVSHQSQPLWLSLYPVFVRVIDEIDQSIKENNRDLFNEKLNEMFSYYELVRPSMIVSHPLGIVEQLDSQMAFLQEDRAKRWEDKDHTAEFLILLEKQIKIAFFQKTDQALQSLLMIALAIGAFICSVLSYVAWRKYKGEADVGEAFLK